MNSREIIEWLNKGNLTKEDITDLPVMVLAATSHEIGHNFPASPAENAKPEDDELWTVEDMVRILKQPKRWIYEHAANNEFPFAKYLNGQGRKGLRFSKKGYQEWLDSRATGR
jgi:hypothetical protein